MAKFSDWDPYSNFVQQGGATDGRFLNASFTLMAAGPPRLSIGATATFAAGSAAADIIDQFIYPIGVVQNFSISHNRNFSRFWEIGSERSFFIAGRTVGQIGLSRIAYWGPSLLRVLMAYFQDADITGSVTVQSLLGAAGGSLGNLANPHDVKIPPGYDNLFINLASDLFSQPHGELFVFKDNNESTLGANYAEACYIPSHTIATDAQGTVIQENVAIQFERLLPVALQTVPTVSADVEELQLFGKGFA